jgi:probable F420-dependent oxidoreductase
MELGVIFPQNEIGNDPIAIRDFAQAAEALGYRHLLAFDHVLGADVSRRPGWTGYYTHRSPFHEPFVLFGYLAGLTRTLSFGTDVLVLPQRQTALVAKQAAAVDVLSGGRLRLGVGTGWNFVEYEALGQDFHTRGRRSEEQIALLRALWTGEVVDFAGRWDRVDGAGINPLPVQRPIPIWLGGGAEKVVRRVGRLADGWFPPMRTIERLDADLALVAAEAHAAGRDPAAIGIEGRVWPRTADERVWAEQLRAWRHPAFTHLSFATMEAGFANPRQHIAAIERFKPIADEVLG